MLSIWLLSLHRSSWGTVPPRPLGIKASLKISCSSSISWGLTELMSTIIALESCESAPEFNENKKNNNQCRNCRKRAMTWGKHEVCLQGQKKRRVANTKAYDFFPPFFLQKPVRLGYLTVLNVNKWRGTQRSRATSGVRKISFCIIRLNQNTWLSIWKQHLFFSHF